MRCSHFCSENRYVSNLRMHNKPLKNPVFTYENECHKTPESQIQNSYNIKNLLDLGKISIAALEGELNKICWASVLQSLKKTWTNARIFFPHLPTCLKDSLFIPQKSHSHWFKFRLGITVVQRKRLINNGYKILTSRQTREKLQCLYENLMSNNFRKTPVLKKISIVN